jgi:hypothetical protein
MRFVPEDATSGGLKESPLFPSRCRLPGSYKAFNRHSHVFLCPPTHTYGPSPHHRSARGPCRPRHTATRPVVGPDALLSWCHGPPAADPISVLRAQEGRIQKNDKKRYCPSPPRQRGTASGPCWVEAGLPYAVEPALVGRGYSPGHAVLPPSSSDRHHLSTALVLTSRRLWTYGLCTWFQPGTGHPPVVGCAGKPWDLLSRTRCPFRSCVSCPHLTIRTSPPPWVPSLCLQIVRV